MRAVRAGARALVVAAVALLLSGCYTAELDAEVSEEGTMSGTLFAGVAITSPQGGGEINGEPIFNEDAIRAMFPGAIVQPRIENGFMGMAVTFTDAPLDYFDTQAIENSLGTQLTITRDSTEFVVEGTQDLSFLTPTTGEDIPDPHVELTLTFPGEVTESNGEIDGRTVTWVNATQVTARAGAAKLFPFQLVGIAVGGVVIVIGVVGALLLRSKRRRAPRPEDVTPTGTKKPTKSRKLPNRRAPKKSPKTAPVPTVVRPVIEPPADWWLEAPATTHRALPAPGSPADAGAGAVHEVTIEDLEDISHSVDESVHTLYEAPGKRRRSRTPSRSDK